MTNKTKFSLHLSKKRCLSFFETSKMAEVQTCPQSIEEVIAARKRKGCGDDDYGKNQFTCIPKYDLSGLVEFCNPRIIGLQERGIYFES